jgi:hypothetical protein
MSNPYQDFFSRNNLQMNKPGKTLVDVLDWLEASDLMSEGGLDTIQSMLHEVHQFSFKTPAEFVGMIRIYLHVFHRFPLHTGLRISYFSLWQDFLDRYYTELSIASIKAAQYILEHQVRYLQVYCDGYDALRVTCEGLVYRIQALTDPVRKTIPEVDMIDVQSVKEVYQAHLSDQEALDVASQHILYNLRK